MCGAVIVYFFLNSGMIGGELVPHFEKFGVIQHVLNSGTSNPGASLPLSLLVPNAEMALLVMWSFLAGFSERVVPGILSLTESRFEGASSRQS